MKTWGLGPDNHGISDLRFGPDGLRYVSRGSRTDAGETGALPHLGKMGEVDLTSAIWRLDPKAVEPKIDIVARGIRNAYSFAWDGAGQFVLGRHSARVSRAFLEQIKPLLHHYCSRGVIALAQLKGWISRLASA